MKMLLSFAAAVLMVAPLAMASPTSCGTTTLDQYLVPNFTCISGNLIFSGFGYSGAANPLGLTVPSTGILVTTLNTPGNEGFQFSDAWSVGTQAGGVSSYQDSLISFTISTVDHSASIDQLSLLFNGSFSGTGLTGVIEQYCLGNTLANCAPGQLNQIKVTDPPVAFSDHIDFAGVSTVSVSKDISVSSGINGTASMSQVINSFGQGERTLQDTPEPMSCVMLGTGLLGIGFLRKRTRKNR